jgi:bifunctional DNase/RNase
MIEMKVFGLALDEESQVPVLILKDSNEQNALPIWIGAMEAMAISLALNDVELPRPMTHDLLLNMILALDAHVVAVNVTELTDGTYYANIEVEVEGGIRRIDSRPSDAIALALRAKVPILVNEAVIEQVAKEAKDASTVAFSSDDSDKWTELLEKFDPNDTKYKM